jgi:hypothetical protein
MWKQPVDSLLQSSRDLIRAEPRMMNKTELEQESLGKDSVLRQEEDRCEAWKGTRRAELA